MKGAAHLKVLKTIAGGVFDVADLFAAIRRTGYGTTRSRIDFESRKIKREHARRNTLDASKAERVVRQRFAQIIYNLKKDGLIEKRRYNRSTALRITRKGLSRLQLLEQRAKNSFPSKHYNDEVTSNDLVIVSFDIPERERRKRDWLREALRNLGLKQMQQSVWMGKRRLPKQFIEDIGKIGIAQHIEIFVIKKPGTLRHIV